MDRRVEGKCGRKLNAQHFNVCALGKRVLFSAQGRRLVRVNFERQGLLTC